MHPEISQCQSWHHDTTTKCSMQSPDLNSSGPIEAAARCKRNSHHRPAVGCHSILLESADLWLKQLWQNQLATHSTCHARPFPALPESSGIYVRVQVWWPLVFRCHVCLSTPWFLLADLHDQRSSSTQHSNFRYVSNNSQNYVTHIRQLIMIGSWSLCQIICLACSAYRLLSLCGHVVRYKQWLHWGAHRETGTQAEPEVSHM